MNCSWLLIITLQISAVEALALFGPWWILGQEGVTVRTGQQESSGSYEGKRPSGSLAKTGSLFLVGGGEIPQVLRHHFFELGGGSEGNLVIIPGASISGTRDSWSEIVRPWLPLGWKRVDVLQPGREFAENSSQDWQELLQCANAVWITGGDQNQLFELFEAQGLNIEDQLLALILRGGAVGGTSAGAAIASKRMIGGGQEIPEMVTGWDLLQNSIVDQHFTQRNRQVRLANAIQNHPDCLGVGIDESTALVVTGKQFSILGAGKVHFVGAPSDSAAQSSLECWALEAGSQGSWPPALVRGSPSSK